MFMMSSKTLWLSYVHGFFAMHPDIHWLENVERSFKLEWRELAVACICLFAWLVPRGYDGMDNL